ILGIGLGYLEIDTNVIKKLFVNLSDQPKYKDEILLSMDIIIDSVLFSDTKTNELITYFKQEINAMSILLKLGEFIDTMVCDDMYQHNKSVLSKKSKRKPKHDQTIVPDTPLESCRVHINDLPHDILICYVFNRVPYSTLCSLLQVSKLFNYLASTGQLWINEQKRENLTLTEIDREKVFKNEKLKFEYLYVNRQDTLWIPINKYSDSEMDWWIDHMYPTRKPREITHQERETKILVHNGETLQEHVKKKIFNIFHQIIYCSKCERNFFENNTCIFNWYENRFNINVELYCRMCQYYCLWRYHCIHYYE
ncbi:unnamed protein product, partial [Didymodactylos carnosus]